MLVVKTLNSEYHVDGDQVKLVSGTPSGHLPFGQWCVAVTTGYPDLEIKVGQSLMICYADDKARVTTAVQSVEEVP